MASITNEQRASKVLGLIFVLFCVFWCPFFLTNVISQLCTTCDQELMGNCMNWFVWVGYVSSGVNPCVYTLFSRLFRKSFLMLIKCKYSDINRRTLNRSVSSRESSVASSNPAVYRRFSRGSIRLLPPVHEDRSQGCDSPRLNEERVWLNHVRSARSMKKENIRKEPWMNSTQKVWRSSWHAVNQEEKTTSTEEKSLTLDKNATYTGFRRMHSESDANGKPEAEEFRFEPTIKETGENDVGDIFENKTWSREEESPNSPSFNLCDQRESNNQDIEASQNAVSSSQEEPTTEESQLLTNGVNETKNTTESNRCEPRNVDERGSEATSRSSLRNRAETNAKMQERNQNRKRSLTNFEAIICNRKERLSREDSGMGASFDNLLPRNEIQNL